MSLSLGQISQDALMLPEIERAQLVQTLRQSLESADEGVEEAWDAEVALRLDSIQKRHRAGRTRGGYIPRNSQPVSGMKPVTIHSPAKIEQLESVEF